MSTVWEIPRSRRLQVAPAAAVLVAVAIAVLAVLTILAVTDHRPLTPVRGDAGGHRVGTALTGAKAASTATSTAAAEASAEASTGRAEASSEHSVTVSGESGDHPAGVDVANSGFATADTGGNVVVGSNEPDGSSSSITTGDATAVGNQSSAWVGP